MRIRVRMDVRRALKREKKIKRPGGNVEVGRFRYEKLPTFCFLCGLMGHVERNCQVRFDNYGSEIVRLWGPELRAPPRVYKPKGGERWLVEDGGMKSETSERAGGDMSGEGKMGVTARLYKPTLPTNIQQLSANWGASLSAGAADDGDAHSVSSMEEEELVVGLEKKRRRGDGSGAGSSSPMEAGEIHASPTKKSAQGIHDPQNMAPAGLFNRSCPSQ
ncbi:hypothetical protein LINPERHAP1_LOCUS36716 [Linum perenne]